MIIWLASYPKSGNTLLRSMIASYLFSEDGSYNFDLIKKIAQFPRARLFHKLGFDINNNEEMIINYRKVQEYINSDSSIKFLKTHMQFANYKNKFPFTDLKNTLGVIYLVRDPRNVVLSFSDFGTGNLEYYTRLITQKISIGGDHSADIDSPMRTLVITGNWADNYNSWKTFREVNKYLIIKYEDFVENRAEVFKKILEFIYELNQKKFILNEKKLRNVIKTTEFSYLQNLEKKYGFNESTLHQNVGKKNLFFNLGSKRNWKNSLNKDSKMKIEKAFQYEMKELGYL